MRQVYGEKFIDRYLIKRLSDMALGLFSTLLIGMVVKQVGSFWGDSSIGQILSMLGQLGSVMNGIGIAVGVAHHLDLQ